MPSLQLPAAALDTIKHARRIKGWRIEDPQWLIAASQIVEPTTNWSSPNHADNQIYAPGVSLSTWKRFLRGNSINSEIFKAFCQVLELDWQPFVEIGTEEPVSLPLHQDWGNAPDVSVFFGRTQELDTLEHWILQDRCRLVAILGMGGMGKTRLSVKLGSGGMGKTGLSLKLAEKLADTIQPQFEFIIWRSLLNAPPLLVLLTDWIGFLSDQQETRQLDDTYEGISRLLHYLRSHRCLLILDNVETILQAGAVTGQYRLGYENYGHLLHQIGDVPHQSCLLLTSREKPKEIARLEGKTRPVRSLELGGLDEASSRELFAEIGEFSGSVTDWQTVIARYDGNPLALELVAKQIHEVFQGNIAAFLNEGKPIFRDLCDLLDWHFDRLSELEQEIVNWLAINREPVAIADLKADILFPLSQEKIPATLQSLKRRLTLVQSDSGFTLQPVLIERLSERLIQQAYTEIQTGSFHILRNYAFLKAQVKEYIREAQARIFLRPLVEQLKLLFVNSTHLQGHLEHILSTLKGKPMYSTGYAAGNLINLLHTINPDLSDRDFADLMIVQAYLSGAMLHRTNFAGSTLEKCRFFETISSITAIAFSADGQWLATGEATGDVRLWEVVSGKPITVWTGHTLWVGAVTFHPTQTILASGSYDQAIRIWDMTSGGCLHILKGHTNWVRRVLFIPNTLYLVSCSDDLTIKIWHWETGECLNTLTGHTNLIWSLDLHPCANLLASGSFDGTVRIWDWQQGSCLNVLQHPQSVGAVAFSLDGQTVISGCRDQAIKFWNLQTGDVTSIPGNFEYPLSHDFNSQRTIVVTGDYEQMLRFWDVKTGTCLRSLPGHAGGVISVAFDPTGTICASGGDDQTIRLWDVATGQNIRTLQGYRNGVPSTVFVRDRPLLLSGHCDWVVRLWDTSTGQCCRIFQGHRGRIWSIAYHAETGVMASASGDRTVRLWQLETGECLGVLKGHRNWVWSVAISPNGRILASGDGDHLIRLWQVATQDCIHVIKGHRGRVWSLEFSPDGQLLAAGSQDQTVKLWDVTSGECITTLDSAQPIWSATFSPDGKTLACSSSNGTVSLWNLQTLEMRVLRGHTQQVWRTQFSPDGSRLASGSDDETVRIWDTKTGECLAVLQGQMGSVIAVAFNPDGAILAGSGQKDIIQLWDMTTGNCLQSLRSPQPCEGMNINGVEGLTEAQKRTLKELGAVEG